MDRCIEKDECICKKYGNICDECINELQVRDSGKSIKLTIRNDEKAISAIIDKCIITDNNPKCDCIFLFNGNRKISFLVELKGFGEIEKAFKQLAYTKNSRDEYRKIIDCFYNLDNKRVLEKFFIVTNGKLNRYEKEKYENEHNIRVTDILVSEATQTIPDLRKYI